MGLLGVPVITNSYVIALSLVLCCGSFYFHWFVLKVLIKLSAESLAAAAAVVPAVVAAAHDDAGDEDGEGAQARHGDAE